MTMLISKLIAGIHALTFLLRFDRVQEGVQPSMKRGASLSGLVISPTSEHRTARRFSTTPETMDWRTQRSPRYLRIAQWPKSNARLIRSGSR